MDKGFEPGYGTFISASKERKWGRLGGEQPTSNSHLVYVALDQGLDDSKVVDPCFPFPGPAPAPGLAWDGKTGG